MRTIKITGKSKMSVNPDMIRVNFSIEGVEKEYDKAIEESAKASSEIKDALGKCGYKYEDIKSVFFNVNTEYDSRRKGDEWIKVFVGYRFRHEMKLELALDNKALGKVLYAISHCKCNPKFSICFFVKDTESVKNELLVQAIEDATNKAEILAKAAKQTLGEIETIDYSWGEINILSRSMNLFEDYEPDCAPMPLRSLGDEYDIDVTPDSIEVSDTVTVVWGLVG